MAKNDKSFEERIRAVRLQEAIAKAIKVNYTLGADDPRAIRGKGEVYFQITPLGSHNARRLRYHYANSRTIDRIVLEASKDDVRDFYKLHESLDDLKLRLPELKGLMLEFPFDGLAYGEAIREKSRKEKEIRDVARMSEYAEKVGYGIDSSTDLF